MKFSNIEIYQLDKYNWTYRIYKKLTSPRAKKDYAWVESYKYYSNSRTCLEAVRQFLIDNVINESEDINASLEGLDKLRATMDGIVSII